MGGRGAKNPLVPSCHHILGRVMVFDRVGVFGMIRVNSNMRDFKDILAFVC